MLTDVQMTYTLHAYILTDLIKIVVPILAPIMASLTSSCLDL